MSDCMNHPYVVRSIRPLPSPVSLLKPFPSLEEKLNSLLIFSLTRDLPSLAAATGERRCHLSRLRPALRRRRASSRYARPFSFLLLCEMDGAPQTLTKLFVFGSESSYNILPTGVTSISFAKIIDVLCWVRPCCSTWFSERAQGAVMQRLGDFRLPPFFNYPPYFT